MNCGKGFSTTLDAAFRATTYRVETPDYVFNLRIDVAAPTFAFWLRQHGVSRWGIVTACNPGGALLPCGENALRHAALQARIAELGFRHVPASNHADAGDWPVEPGFCVLDQDEKQLLELAAGFGQSAIVCGQSGSAVARLVWRDW